jgi:TonB family protein
MSSSVRSCTLFHLAAASGIWLFLSTCASKSPLQGTYPAGSPHYRVETDSLGRKHGLERWWHENGVMKSEATWRGGVRDGAYRAWYPDGTPWYAGRDSLGVPLDTLRVWHPNGKLRSLSVFVAGEPVRLDEYDTAGLTTEESRVRAEDARRRALEASVGFARKRRADSLATLDASRAHALQNWSAQVRSTVETWWSLPEGLKKTPRRATARLRVARDGTLLGVTWTSKSGSRDFDARAARALAKVRKLPPVPPQVAAPLELSYTFTTSGVAQPRRRLQVRDPSSALGDSVAGNTERQ